ncbi:hypothetical protein DPEC_G00143280 [Dallia pectoralis]|uniref:Uncharacterized protein n=1 Tax=Dallia pectoralis TaxID=75939 RepID=A0ACC2GMW8_DALPE|nr:hypothetical protein DPEC_G00143280 [Dallia pectoralis]
MDSQQMVVLTRGGSDDTSVGQSLKRSGTVPNIHEEPVDLSLLRSRPLAGDLQSCALKQTNLKSNYFKTEKGGGGGDVPDVAVTSLSALQETGEVCGLNQPITVKTGIPCGSEQPDINTSDVTGLCNRPIADSAALSLTKDIPHLNSKWSLEASTPLLQASSNGPRSTLVSVAVENGDQSSGAMDQSSGAIDQSSEAMDQSSEAMDQSSEAMDQSPEARNQLSEAMDQSSEAMDHSEEPVHRTKAEDEKQNGDRDVPVIRNGDPILQMPLLFHTTQTERTVGRNGDDQSVTPYLLPGCRGHGEEQAAKEGGEDRAEASDGRREQKQEEEEEGVVLDLSLPKKRESKERRLWHESSLLMEVDEVEGDGDRDIVEEDDDDQYVSILRIDGADILGGPLSSPTCGSASLFPYFTSIDSDCEGLLLIDDQGIPYTLTPEGHKVPQIDLLKHAGPQPGQSLVLPSSLEVSSSFTPDEILPSSLQLSSPLVDADTNTGLGFSLPLSLIQNSPSGSTSMFLLLSTSSSTSSQLFSTSTPIALIDPSTGQLSQISNSSLSSLSLSSPLPSQIVTSESPLPASLSQPVIRVSPDNHVTMPSGVTPSMTPVTPLPPISDVSSPLTQPVTDESSDAVAFSSTTIKHSEPSSSEPDPDPQSLIMDEKQMGSVPNESVSAKASPVTHSSSMTFDPSSDAVSQSDTPESERSSLAWNDHLYFSSTAPPSPPPDPNNPSSRPRNPEPPDPLDLVSPASPPSSGPRRVLYCPLCPRIFYYLSDLERHSITHSQNKPHVCLQCGKAFKRSSHLQRHNHIHTGQRNFVCPICSKRFREAGELQRHQRVHTGEKPYQCSLCHTRFAERNTLRRHTKRKHPFHQAAVDTLTEGGDGRGGEGEEETEEWYSSTVSNLDNSDSEPDSEVMSSFGSF